MSTAPVFASDAAGLERAAAAVRAGQTVGMPTETVYGLAADATNPEAVAAIYAIKNRPTFNPLIAHVASVDEARAEGLLDARAEALAAAFWPGPLTLVLPVNPAGRTCELARAGLQTIAVRVPSQPVAQALLQEVARPLAAPSANPSGRLSPTRADEVARELGDAVALVLDGGVCRAGIESSIVLVLPDTQPTLLRPGAIAREDIESVVGELATPTDESISAPGQLRSHYAPRARMRLDADIAEAGEVLLAFGPNAPTQSLNLSSTGDLVEAAANLYHYLRKLDASGADVIAVMPVPKRGLGEAINDRLQRAAAPR